jgi:YbbR domain-containing protein
MPGQPFWGTLARNGRLKVAAFGLALFLWVLVRVGAPGQRDLLLPVNIRLEDPGWMVLGDPIPSAVLVRFRGPPTEMFRLNGFDGLAVAVPITEVSDEEMVIPLQAGWVQVDGYRGVQVEDIVPSAINLHLDRLVTRTIPVRISTSGRLPEHLALTRALSLTPNFVRVSGPAGLIERLDTLDIVPVALSDVGEQTTVETVVDTAGMGRATFAPYVLRLGIPAEKSIERVIEGVPVIVASVLGGGQIEVFPEAVQVTVTGARSRVSELEAELLRAVVPSDALGDLGVVEERQVPIVVEGVPSYVSVVAGADTVAVRRRLEL